MSSWIYIIAVILFAILSNVNKAGKNKRKGTPRGGMPTFGGGDDNPLRRTRRPGNTLDGERQEQPGSGSGFPVPGSGSPRPSRQTTAQEVREYDASPAFPQSAQFPTPEYETGEGLSLEQAEERDGVQERAERMQRELERLQTDFEGIAGAADYGSTYGTDNPSGGSTVQRSFADNREGLRSGLIWAEILGPPRSRRPHSSRR
jgi:hypothetical protein